ncbi:DUF6625 family protein [Phormidesmis priestleyi]|uniref:DUF6625 family protein n=1 Tax=Phormidesmis priestleyi TaxID=268141 RepID=UPI00083AB17D|nr:DUF6625 family protein [Phormidesmis priestleyi]
MNKIALVNCYMGTLPNYFQLFLDSAVRNPDIDFYIFNDETEKINVSHNVKIIPLSLGEFNKLASSKLELSIGVTHNHGYKLCDLKPAYGVIFEDYLRGYDFWGYCDIDIIWGKVTNFVTPEVLSSHDVITVEKTHLAGHFTLFRNSGITIDLFRQTEDYKKVFADINRAYWFDESCKRFGRYYPIQELIDSAQTVSMYDIVMELSQKKQLRLFMKYVIREYPDPFRFVYRNGILEDSNVYLGLDENGHGYFKELDTKEQFMYFHLYHVKSDWRFYISQLDRLPSEFHVTSAGIIPGAPNDLISVNKWRIQKILFSGAFLAQSLSEMGLFSFLKRLTSKLNKRVTKGEPLRLREICRTGSHYPS